VISREVVEGTVRPLYISPDRSDRAVETTQRVIAPRQRIVAFKQAGCGLRRLRFAQVFLSNRVQPHFGGHFPSTLTNPYGPIAPYVIGDENLP